VKKRSDFEHKIVARGTSPLDFAKFASWEINLEHLRQARCKRLRIKPNSTISGQPRIFGIFDRGTKKHPGDVALWMSYLEYVRKAKATKKFKTVLTSAIRLHPTKSELWLYAARWALEADSDMSEARSYMQRGTRFCTTTRDLWIEYAKLEMIYLLKIAMRRRILGLDVDPTATNEEAQGTAGDDGFESSADVIALTDLRANTMKPSMIEGVKVDSEAQKDPMTSPALNGAIPLAIFDASRKHPFFCPSAAEDFFDMFTLFTQVRCTPAVLQHVLDSMTEAYPTDPCTFSCYIRQPCVGIEHTSAEFPVALGSSLERLKEGLEKTTDKAELSKKIHAWIVSILALDDLDPGIQTVLNHTMRKLEPKST
jgi:U3 small nucleolar RNA-associated protein 6